MKPELNKRKKVNQRGRIFQGIWAEKQKRQQHNQEKHDKQHSQHPLAGFKIAGRRYMNQSPKEGAEGVLFKKEDVKYFMG